MANLCLACPLFAAIVTERNDATAFGNASVGCIPPPAYTFVGSASSPGIDSCWIPYGTYTGGTGGTEYTRVTSNLVGVVASALGGAMEREWARPYGSADECLLRPLALPAYSWEDEGEYLASSTNKSLRIADQLNLPVLMHSHYAEDHSYYQSDETLEQRLLRLAPDFGSRHLDYLTGNAQPPISTTWFSDIPYKVADTNLWKNVWPTYAACTNDPHFFPGRTTYERILPESWGEVGGWDIGDAIRDLYDALKEIPLDCTNMVGMLAADTGLGHQPGEITNDFWIVNGDEQWTLQAPNLWEPPQPVRGYPHLTFDNRWRLWINASTSYDCIGGEDATTLIFVSSATNWTMSRVQTRSDSTDDFDHWRNDTTRLDWKRLGIICQLERQMETTYRDIGDWQDELPYRYVETEHHIEYEAELTIDLPDISTAQTATFPMRDLSPSWSREDERYVATTNDVGWTYPTCRVPAPSIGDDVLFSGDDLGGSVELDETAAEDMLTTFTQSLGLTNGTYNLIVSGEWTVENQAFTFSAERVESWGWVHHPSNTVTFTVDGEEYAVWGPEPIASKDWHIYTADDDGHMDMDLLRRSGTWYLYLNWGDSLWIDGTEQYSGVPGVGENASGSFSMPSVSFEATGGGDYTNWMWTATGIDGTNCTRTVSGSQAVWEWSDGSSIEVSRDEYYGPDYDYTWAMPVSSDPNASLELLTSGILSRVTFPAFAVRWESATNTAYECVWTNDTPSSLYYQIPIVYDVTNTTVRAMLGIDKHCRGSSTYSTEDVMDDVIGNFTRPYSEDWGRIYSQSRPTVECLISEVGSSARADSTNTAATTIFGDGFTWENIKSSYSARRKFRMNPYNAEARAQNSADLVRFQMLQSLDAACKSECVSRGGWNIGNIASVGRITQAERVEIMDSVLDGNVNAAFTTTVSNLFFVAGTVVVDDGTPAISVSGCTAGYGTPSALPAYVGTYRWDLSLSTDPAAYTNLYESARADGVQAPVVKTLWKFKNLRDPEL